MVKKGIKGIFFFKCFLHIRKYKNIKIKEENADIHKKIKIYFGLSHKDNAREKITSPAPNPFLNKK